MCVWGCQPRENSLRSSLRMSTSSSSLAIMWMYTMVVVAVLSAVSSVTAAASSSSSSSQRSVSRNYGPPVFFLQDPTDGLCFSGSGYTRCGLNSLWFVTGKAGNYQVHREVMADADDKGDIDSNNDLLLQSESDLCLVSSDCAQTALNTSFAMSESVSSELALGACSHCGALKWNILGDNEAGYVLTQDKNKLCLLRQQPRTRNAHDNDTTTTTTSSSSRSSIDNSGSKGNRGSGSAADEAVLVSCETGYSAFSLQFVSSADLATMRSPAAELVSAALVNDVVRVHALLNNKNNHRVPVDARDWDNVTASIAAAAAGHLPLLRELLETYGADAEAVDKDGLSALMEAARAKHVAVVRYLVEERGVALQTVARSGVSALWMAASEGQLEIVRLLLHHHKEQRIEQQRRQRREVMDVNNARSDGMSVLMVASAEGHAPVVRELLSFSPPQPEEPTELATDDREETVMAAAVDVQTVDKNGASALTHAAESGSLETVSLLLAHQAEVNVMASSGVTPLILAAAQGHVAVCEALLGAGATVEVEHHPDGANALMFAAAGGHVGECILFSLPFTRHPVPFV
jgi:ankyrin repeat protein